jgi:hypothetical protein
MAAGSALLGTPESPSCNARWSRSQWNCTLIWPIASTWISVSSSPATTAVTGTCTFRRLGRGGTNVIDAGAHSNEFS